MHAEVLRVLLVEDDEDDYVLTRDLLADAQGVGFDLHWAPTAVEGLRALRDGGWDALLLDFRLGAMSGLEFMGRMPLDVEVPPVLLLTGQDGDGVDVAAMRAGAADFLLKREITTPLLERALRYAVEQRRGARALRESETRFRQLAENIGAVFWLHDAAAERTLYVSPAYERIWGRPVAELYANPGTWRAYVHPDDAHLVAGPKKPDPYEVEYRILRPDGEVRWIRDRGFPIRAEDGRVRRTAGIAEDVTEGRAAQAVLASREAYFRALIENAQDLIVIMDDQGRIRDHSPSVERLLGFGHDFLHGIVAFDLMHPDDAPGVLAAFQGILGTPGAAVTAEYRIRTADGGWRILESTGHNLIHHSAVQAVVVNSHDVTDRRQAEDELRMREEQLRQSQKLEAVGRLAGGIAHDFNNLLTAIQGNTEMMLMEVPPEGSLFEDLQEIKRASHRAAELTRQLLAFSRRQMLQPRVLDLNAVVMQMTRMLSRMIGENVRLVPRLFADAPRVKADPGQFEQVLMNLAVNARDAMPRGGCMIVQTRNVDFTEADMGRHSNRVMPGPYVELSVTDDGVGMAPEVLARVFEPFFTTKEPGQGTGLGLATVYGIVDQSGGCVVAESEPGRGSTFRVYLPRVLEPAEAEQALPPESRERVRPATILLVEDEDAVRTLARKILERTGYTVIDAGGAAEARRRFDEADRRIDLLVTDVVMPDQSGRELAEELVPLLPELRVLFMSGYTEDALIRHGVLESRYRLIQKPFSPDALVRAVREVIEAEPAMDC